MGKRINIGLDAGTYSELDFLRYLLNGKGWNSFIQAEVIPMLRGRGAEIIEKFYIPYLKNFQFSNVNQADFDHATNEVLKKYISGELAKEFKKVEQK